MQATTSCATERMQAAIRVEDERVVHLIRPLLEKPRSSWSKEDAANVLSLLQNRNCVILGGCSGESVAQWLKFYHEWEAYEDEHPGVEAVFDSCSQVVEVDPPVVCFTFPAAGPPAGFAAAVAGTDANAGVLAVLCSDGTASSGSTLFNHTHHGDSSLLRRSDARTISNGAYR